MKRATCLPAGRRVNEQRVTSPPLAYHSLKLSDPPRSVYLSQKKSPPRRRIFFGCFNRARMSGTPTLTEENAMTASASCAALFKAPAYRNHRINDPPVSETIVTLGSALALPYDTTCTSMSLEPSSRASAATYVAGPPMAGG